MWYSLWDKVCNADNLDQAILGVIMNRGSAGVDGQTTTQLSMEWTRQCEGLQQELRTGQYRPLPARRAWIPKLGSHELRPLGIPAVKDRVVQTALKLATLIEGGDSDHRQYLEALGVVLAHELMQINAGTDRAEAPPSGGLAAWQRRKAVSYIEEHLAETISLEALARLVGLSACYFCRAFRQSLGMPPQRYQLSQRIERAKTLLARRAASVTDVSLTVGYNDTSAFCTAFRRLTGLTPSAYRRHFS